MVGWGGKNAIPLPQSWQSRPWKWAAMARRSRLAARSHVAIDRREAPAPSENSSTFDKPDAHSVRIREWFYFKK
jgi:hypothetical protein